MSVNKVTLLGNVCHEPKIKAFDNGGKVAQFSLATNKRAFKTKDGREIPEQTEFHNIVINKKGLAEVAEKYVKKGDKLYIEGELRTRKYADANGAERYITEVYVNEMEMLSSKNGGGQAGAAANGATPPPPPATDDDGLPF